MQTLLSVSISLGSLAAVLVLVAMSGPLRWLAACVAAAVVGMLSWGVAPTLARDFYALPWIVLLAGLAGVVSYFAGRDQDEGPVALRIGIPATVTTVGLAWILGLFVTSWGMFGNNETAYRDVIQVEERPMEAGIELLDQSHARLVDSELAKRRAVELLGVEKGLGSSYVVGEPTVQIVQGREVWVAPLEPASFWTWKDNDGSPGYVVVSSTNYSDARIVLDRPVRYSMHAYLRNNVETAVYEADPSVGRADYSFEIDEEGRPYWVATTYRHSVGASGAQATGVELLDAATGERRWYAIGTEPAWVDRVVPEDMAEDQLTLWGDYVKGYWNWSRDQVVHPTKGMALVYTRDGRAAWFTGVVNARSQSSTNAATNGFALVDAKTGKASVHYRQGISELAAKGVMEGAVQNSQYVATAPIAYMVHGALTYVAVLKDKSGNPRLIGMASAFDRSVVATGDNLDEATRAYVGKLRTSASRPAGLAAAAAPRTVSGTLVRSGPFGVDGRSYMLARLSVAGQVRDYTMDLALAPIREIVLARPGDAVALEVLSVPEGADEVRSVKVTPRD